MSSNDLINNLMNGIAFGMLTSRPMSGGCCMPMSSPLMSYPVGSFSVCGGYNPFRVSLFAPPVITPPVMPMNFGYSNFGSRWNFNLPQINFANYTPPATNWTMPTFNWSMPTNTSYNYSRYSSSNTNYTGSTSLNEIYTAKSSDVGFNKMLNYILTWEGGYTEINDGSGGATNRGVTTKTYNNYRSKKGLPTQPVKYMTNDEMNEIYHNIYVECGANRIENPKLALYVFDTAVNMGPQKAKEILSQSGGNIEKFDQIRRQKYKSIAENKPGKRKFLKGWINRANGIKTFAQNNLSDTRSTLA